MKTTLFLCTALMSLTAFAATPALQQADCGTIDRHYLYSTQLSDTIAIDVWKPADYQQSSARYPVIYMHDGQNLYDRNTTWNHQSWEVDSVMCALIDTGKIAPAIVVGIHSDQVKRVADLMPQKAISKELIGNKLSKVGIKDGKVHGDDYLAFLTETVKPFIDKRYHTQPDRANTTVMGSSMGGLMSIYALCERPDVFGNALCLSTHWTGTEEIADAFAGQMYDYINANLPKAEPTLWGDGYVPKLYFDHGTATLDAAYGPYEEKVLNMLRAKGYDDIHLKNMVANGAAHEENAWCARLSVPLLFLLGK